MRERERERKRKRKRKRERTISGYTVFIGEVQCSCEDLHHLEILTILYVPEHK